MNPVERRIEHLRFEHNLRVDSSNLDLIGDILCAGEDAGCEDCSRLLDTSLSKESAEERARYSLSQR
jgi:hypothetical protein